MIKWVLVSMLVFLCSCENERNITSAESNRYLQIVNDNDVVYLDGRIISTGRDYSAYGKYRINNGFDEEGFVEKNHLSRCFDDNSPFCRQDASKVTWFSIHEEMRKFQRVDMSNQLSKTIWIDDSEGVIFVESVTW